MATQIEARSIRDEDVLRAMRTVPRHLFVPEEWRARAYEDRPLPIGAGQTISQPYIVAYMTSALGAVEPRCRRVLEVGTGCGYQSAVLAELVDRVFSIELTDELAAAAEARLRALGYDIELRVGDGGEGWPEAAPFDGIIVTCAAPSVPPALVDQLAPGGRMVIPVGSDPERQELLLITKDARGLIEREALLPVRFVPFRRPE